MPTGPLTIFDFHLSLTQPPELLYSLDLHECVPVGLNQCAGADGGIVLEPNDAECNNRADGRAYCPLGDPAQGCIMLPKVNVQSRATYSAVERSRKGDVLRKARVEGRAASATAPMNAFTMVG